MHTVPDSDGRSGSVKIRRGTLRSVQENHIPIKTHPVLPYLEQLLCHISVTLCGTNRTFGIVRHK